MARNESSMKGDGIEEHLTSNSLFDVLVSSTPILVLALSWTARVLFDRKAAVRDAAAITLISSIRHRGPLLHFTGHILSKPYTLLSSSTTLIAIVFISIVSHSGTLVEWFGKPKYTEKKQSRSDVSPLILPCRTTHSRLFPTKHSFSYSYLFVGIPVGWAGRAGTILSADSHCWPGRQDGAKTWFSVEAEDYLERGSHPDGLRGKLFDYLRGQGVAPSDYSRAFLVTAPRFLGFSFNPVSFWYLYDKANVLQAMVVEVNNTFDERRMYFMERTTADPTVPKEGERYFKHSWEKDFHVSPFNSRDGSYSIQAADPYANSTTGNVNIDCNIVLKAADGRAKTVARVFSSDAAIDATAMTRWQTLAFASRWWWVGLMTNVRILREARILWVKNLQVYYRPEVMKTSIGRQESCEEVHLEPSFGLLLERLVQCSPNDLLLTYMPAAGPRRGTLEIIGRSASETATCSQPTLEVTVLTPAFYSRFVRFHDCEEAFNKLFFDVPDSGKHLFVSDPPALRELLSGTRQLNAAPDKAPFRWHLLACLRGKVPIQSALCTRMSGGTASGRPVLGLSQLDVLVLNSGNDVSTRRYFRSVTALLLSHRMAFGWTEILRLYGMAIWALLLCVAAGSGQKLLRPTSGVDQSDRTFLTVLALLAPHLWAFGVRSI